MFRQPRHRASRLMFLFMVIASISGAALVATPVMANMEFGFECTAYEATEGLTTYPAYACIYLDSTYQESESETTTESCSLGRTGRPASQEVTTTTTYNVVKFRVEHWWLLYYLSPDTGGTWTFAGVTYEYNRDLAGTTETRTECLPVHGKPPQS